MVSQMKPKRLRKCFLYENLNNNNNNENNNNNNNNHNINSHNYNRNHNHNRNRNRNRDRNRNRNHNNCVNNRMLKSNWFLTALTDCLIWQMQHHNCRI